MVSTSNYSLKGGFRIYRSKPTAISSVKRGRLDSEIERKTVARWKFHGKLLLTFSLSLSLFLLPAREIRIIHEIQ